MFSKVSMVTPTLLPPFPQICHFACLQAKSSLTNLNLYCFSLHDCMFSKQS